ncbi:hypothetical protein HD806DRAFT_245163 [Xylariaceae sp. AK1471]|nr:hypothetical protein HD806DRAFT_245163 [Xylariaceae sp. AK1471]
MLQVFSFTKQFLQHIKARAASKQNLCRPVCNKLLDSTKAVVQQKITVCREKMGAIPKPPKGHFNVLYFASANSFTSREYDTLPAPLSTSKFFDALEEKYSGIKDKILSSCLVTVNLNYVDVPNSDSEDALVIQEGDEVAIIPPVSSG